MQQHKLTVQFVLSLHLLVASVGTVYALTIPTEAHRPLSTNQFLNRIRSQYGFQNLAQNPGAVSPTPAPLPSPTPSQNDSITIDESTVTSNNSTDRTTQTRTVSIAIDSTSGEGDSSVAISGNEIVSATQPDQAVNEPASKTTYENSSVFQTISALRSRFGSLLQR